MGKLRQWKGDPGGGMLAVFRGVLAPRAPRPVRSCRSDDRSRVIVDGGGRHLRFPTVRASFRARCVRGGERGMSTPVPVAPAIPAPPSAPPVRSSRPYLYALDPLRGITALIVILVHVLIFVNFDWQSVRAQEWQA